MRLHILSPAYTSIFVSTCTSVLAVANTNLNWDTNKNGEKEGKGEQIREIKKTARWEGEEGRNERENKGKGKHTTRTVLCNSSHPYACMHIKTHTLIHTSCSIRHIDSHKLISYLSFSLSLSICLSQTYTHIRTHTHAHTLSLSMWLLQAVV